MMVANLRESELETQLAIPYGTTQILQFLNSLVISISDQMNESGEIETLKSIFSSPHLAYAYLTGLTNQLDTYFKNINLAHVKNGNAFKKYLIILVLENCGLKIWPEISRRKLKSIKHLLSMGKDDKSIALKFNITRISVLAIRLLWILTKKTEWNKGEINNLLDFVHLGIPYKIIAKILGRTELAIYREIGRHLPKLDLEREALLPLVRKRKINAIVRLYAIGFTAEYIADFLSTTQHEINKILTEQ